MDITIAKIDKLREKKNISYSVAKNALEITEGNVLDALIYLEKNNKDRKETEILGENEFEKTIKRLVKKAKGIFKNSSNSIAIFSSNESRYKYISSKRINIFTLFGSNELDFRDIEIKDGETLNISTFIVFGSASIYNSEKTNIKINVVPLLGSIDNRSINHPDSNNDIIINGIVLFGSLEIR